MSSAGEGAPAPMLYCPLCGTNQLCDECLNICAAMVGETEGTVPTFSKDLEQTLDRALTIARERSEPHAIEAHLLLALVDDPDAAAVLRGCNVDLDAARQRITAAFTEHAETPQEGADATPSAAFQRIVQRAVVHVQSAKDDGQVTGADVLVAAFAEPPAAELLQALGLTRYEAVSYISHGSAGRDQDRAADEGAAQMPRGSRAEVRLLNDDYTPMEFVVEVLARTFAHDQEAATRLMLEIHRQGSGTCGVYPVDAANAKVMEVRALAREHQHPLHCILVPIPA
jgi:ATP-dependent Clp protease adapter protein ClpS